MSREAFPNQLVSFYVQAFVSGVPVPVGLVSGTLTIGSGDPIACSINGQYLLATVPFDTALGTVNFYWNWVQVVNAVTSSQGPAVVSVTIIAQPSGSSQSYVPANVTRQCLRLCEPDDRTDEQFIEAPDPRNPGSLAIYCNPPYSILRAIFANLPSSGPDVVTMNYVDGTGQPGVLSINCTLWCSDNGYVLISADNGVQMFISSIRADFWQTNAPTINQRNTDAGALPLMACSNAARYGYDVLLPNQGIPSLFIYDGIVLNSGTSSSPNVI